LNNYISSHISEIAVWTEEILTIMECPSSQTGVKRILKESFKTKVKGKSENYGRATIPECIPR
jgi:hypothetical protein